MSTLTATQDHHKAKGMYEELLQRHAEYYAMPNQDFNYFVYSFWVSLTILSPYNKLSQNCQNLKLCSMGWIFLFITLKHENRRAQIIESNFSLAKKYFDL